MPERTLRGVICVVCFGALAACSLHQPSTSNPGPPLPVYIGVTNEGMLETRFELRMNGVVVLDTVAGPPVDLTGRALEDTVRVSPGTYQVQVINGRTGVIRETTLEAEPGPMFIVIRFLPDSTVLGAGKGILEFME